MEGFNVLVCVSRQVDGMFVTDMVQAQKHRAVKEAASKALELLKAHLTAVKPAGPAATLKRDSFHFDSSKVDLNVPGAVPKGSSLAALPGHSEEWTLNF